MSTQAQQIANLIACEISEHFTTCNEGQESYAGLVMDNVVQTMRSVTLFGHDKDRPGIHRHHPHLRPLPRSSAYRRPTVGPHPTHLVEKEGGLP
jgi:hypothetical protein